MNRTTLDRWDRMLAGLAALTCIAVGPLVAWWALETPWQGRSLEVESAATLQPWVWVGAALGLAALAVGIMGSVAHVRRAGVREVLLPGSDHSGQLQVNPDAAVAAAAEVLAAHRGISAASGRMVREGDRLTAQISVTVPATTDLGQLTQQVRRVAEDLHQVLPRDDVQLVVQTHVAAGEPAKQLR